MTFLGAVYARFITPLFYADPELGARDSYTIETLLSNYDTIVVAEGNFTKDTAQ